MIPFREPICQAFSWTPGKQAMLRGNAPISDCGIQSEITECFCFSIHSALLGYAGLFPKDVAAAEFIDTAGLREQVAQRTAEGIRPWIGSAGQADD